METGLNFRTRKGQEDYIKAYDKSMELWSNPYTERYIDTSFGKTHVIVCGDMANKPLVLLHAASCGATIWYPNATYLSKDYCIYAVDLISEASKSILMKKIKTPSESAQWLNETFDALDLDEFHLCGLSIGGWNATNYAIHYPHRVSNLILLSPIQTLTKMYFKFFFKIMKMGFHPTRENVENYIGWGSAKEAPLPDSVITQFIISVMNVNSNAAFPKMIKSNQLKNLIMPTMILLGENEFAFNISKAITVAKSSISNLEIDVIKNASHLISVSAPDIVNCKISEFLGH